MEAIKREEPQRARKEVKEITFRCKFCGEDKPLSEMRTVNRFFPPLIVCAKCEKSLN